MNGFKKLVSVFAFLALLALPASFAAADDKLDQQEVFEAEKAALELKIEKRDIELEEKEYELKQVIQKLDDTKRRIEVCASDDMLSSRLVCYDEIARNLGYKTAEDIRTAEEKIDDRGFWAITKKISPLGDEVISLKVDSVEPVISRAGTRRNPTFTIRCRSKRTDVFLDWKSSLSSYKTFVRDQAIVYKIDNEPEVAEMWELSQDSHAAFHRSPIEFVRKLKGKERMTLVVTPYSDKTATLVFPLRGLDAALATLVDQCYN